MSDIKFDQSKFDRTLEEYLGRLKAEVRPRAINKKLFFISKKAAAYSPRVTSERIGADLLFRQVEVVRKDSTTGQAPLGYVLAAKRAAKDFSSSQPFMRAVAQQEGFARGSGNELVAWRRHVKQTYEKMAIARARSAGFLRVGWLSVMTELRQLTGLSFGGISGPAGEKLVGRLKSKVTPATAANGQGAVGINLAIAHWDTRGGQYLKGNPPLERAMAEEEQDTAQFLAQEMAKDTERFNRAQH